MNIFADGVAVLNNQAWTVFSVLGVVIWGQILIITLCRRVFKDQFTNFEYISLGMAGWILPVLLLSVLLFAGMFLFGENALIVLSALAVIVLIYFLLFVKWDKAMFLTSLVFIVAFAAFLILQLAFLKNMLLPSYFDSAEHYRIIKYFVEYYETSGSEIPLIHYYHVGFHLFIASVSRIFHLGIVDAMLVFGQIILTILPFSLFFIVKQETGSNMAAAFTCLLAGVGWHMPSHAMDWGKYPALFSLVGIHFVLNIGYLLYRNNQHKSARTALYWLLAGGVFISALLHTRSLIIFAFMGASLLLAVLRRRLSPLFQQIFFVFVLLILVIEIATVQNNPVLTLLFGAYVGRDVFATGLVIFLFLFSAWLLPELTFYLLALLSLAIAGLFIPVTGFSGYGVLSLLDRPYVQMMLYLPLSIFGGLGLAGLKQYLQRFSLHQKALNPLAVLFTFVFAVVNAGFNHDFYPSTCCQIASHDDLSAIQWIDETLPPDSKILIASTSLYVTSLESPDTLAGVDGGIWISPLTSRRTILVRNTLSFDQQQTHTDLCRENADYIYIGGVPQSFNASQFDDLTDWYQAVFSLPKARVYHIIGCS